jgi:methionyl-tRNA synthetase
MPTASAELLITLGHPDGDARQFSAAIATPIAAAMVLPAPLFPRYKEPAEA